MPKINDIFQRIVNRIFRKSNYLMLSNVSKENYDKYHSTYDTLAKIFGELDDNVRKRSSPSLLLIFSSAIFFSYTLHYIIPKTQKR